MVLGNGFPSEGEGHRHTELPGRAPGAAAQAGRRSGSVDTPSI